MEKTIRVGEKGVMVIPKRLREAAGIAEKSDVRVQLVPFGILLRPVVEDPVEALARLPIAPRKESSVETVRKLRERIDWQVRK